jgi:hypothetical protein
MAEVAGCHGRGSLKNACFRGLPSGVLSKQIVVSTELVLDVKEIHRAGAEDAERNTEKQPADLSAAAPSHR